MRYRFLVAPAFALILCVANAQASSIVLNNSFSDGYFTPGVQAIGHSVTTPIGGPWNSITFNFYGTVVNNLGQGVALGSTLAYGDLYILTQTYTGLPSGLSTATPGFLATTSTISSGEWVLPPQ
jgi:hypothetical protein